jgi:polysaccharide pyruvyl transferase WcaK-like protein
MYGVIPENNFGGPSLMHGAREVIKNVNKNYEIVFYQFSKPVDIAIRDMEFPVHQIPYKRTHDLLIDALKYKYGIRPQSEEKYKFLEEIKSSDIVVNLFGINYSSNFDKGKYSYARAIKMAIGKYSINFIAKMYGVKSVKCTASYGPITSKIDIISAKFSANRIFDVMVARENESKKQIEKVSKKEISVSPDLANLMPYSCVNKRERVVGISISHQIIRQWNSNEKYIDCMVNLVEHIYSSTGLKIVLIPNEIATDNSYSDVYVAEQIRSLLKTKNIVDILDVASMSSNELKNKIAACDVVVASRYHSCVAALSSGVPTLVVGWHYKYGELLEWYGQSKWLISNENCTSDKLISMFNEFWGKREENRMVIKEHFPAVKEALINVGKEMFCK